MVQKNYAQEYKINGSDDVWFWWYKKAFGREALRMAGNPLRYRFSSAFEDGDHFRKLQCRDVRICPLLPQLLQLLASCGDNGFHEKSWQSPGHRYHRIWDRCPASSVQNFQGFWQFHRHQCPSLQQRYPANLII